MMTPDNVKRQSEDGTPIRALAEKIQEANHKMAHCSLPCPCKDQIESLLREAIEEAEQVAIRKTTFQLEKKLIDETLEEAYTRAAEVARKYKAEYVTTRSACDETLAQTADEIAAAIEKLREETK